jgi:uncharacterized membrane protein YagU involved in acid resistance
MRRLLAGLVGGVLGSAAMSGFLRVMFPLLPERDRYSLPPRRIAMRLVTKSGFEPPRREPDRRALTLTAHYAYGTTLGGVYALIAPRTPGAALAGSVPFALSVWVGSYLGWLPAVGLHPPATRESVPRNALMIAAHFVWAGVIAATVVGTARRGRAV